jgi:nitroreductase
MTLSLEEVNRLKNAPVESMLPVLATRWSPRSFKDQPVSSADLKTILEAARWSASSSNEQPWRYFVGVKGTETWDKIFACLVPFNQSWAKHAGVLLLTVAQAKAAKGSPNHYALYDLGQATATAIIQAHALGLVSHSMGGFNHDAARQTFGLSEDFALGAVVAIGHQDEPSALPNETLLERELAPRERKPLPEIALSALNVPVEL